MGAYLTRLGFQLRSHTISLSVLPLSRSGRKNLIYGVKQPDDAVSVKLARHKKKRLPKMLN